MGPHPLSPLFDPRSIAVFGAADGADGVGRRVLGNLVAGGFDGRLLAISPKGSDALGCECFARIKDSDGEIYVAVIATPIDAVPDVLAELGDTKVK